MGVDFSSFTAFMPQKLLNIPQFNAFLQQVGGKAVAQGMHGSTRQAQGNMSQRSQEGHTPAGNIFFTQSETMCQRGVLKQLHVSPHSFRDNNPDAGMLLAVHNFQEVNSAAQFIATEMEHGPTGRQPFLAVCQCLAKGIH
jgi:hypothetical protein